MKTTTKLLVIAAMMMATTTAIAQKGTVRILWENGAPNNNGNPTDTAKITVYLPSAKQATGRAVVCCPGGGYSHLAMEHEGTDWASFFNQQGIAFIVLKYRMPRGNFSVPISDAEEAIRTVRRNAKSWNIDPQQVGIMGSSAGGHLASTIATHAKGDAKPDFQILFYPVITMDPSFTHKGSHDNFFGEGHSKRELKKLEQLYSNDMQVTRATPRAFIALSDDDTAVLPANGANYYQECFRHDVPAAIHIYPSGGHGWGIRPSFRFHAEMLLELKAWLQSF
jgi:acetyl esterase/lipase